MSTISNVKRDDINASNSDLFSRFRTTIETAFYRNNVVKVTTLEQAYKLAKKAPGTIVTDLPVYKSEELGIGLDAKVLIFNDGIITGRQAKARRLVNNSNVEKYATIVRESVFHSRKKKMYHAIAYVGLHTDFMVKAHLLIPEGYENTMYSWMLNFQSSNLEMDSMYDTSTAINEGDIFLYSDPEEIVEGHVNGTSIFDHKHNCATLLGLRYFGELILRIGGNESSFIIQKIESTLLSNLYARCFVQNCDFKALPFPLRISSVTGTTSPSESRVAPTF